MADRVSLQSRAEQREGSGCSTDLVMSPDIMQPRQHAAAGGGAACGKRRVPSRAAPCAVAGAQRRKGRGLLRKEGARRG